MDGDSSTNKAKLLNSMLLRAWKERWTDAQWGMNLKTILPQGVSGDAYDLADCILQQAVIGSDANKLVLSYLKHSLCSQIISHAAVLKRISKYEGYDKTYCVIALLDFLQSVIDGVTCRSKQEETTLPNALLSLVHWLAKVYSSILESYFMIGSINQAQQKITDIVTNLMEKITSNLFFMGVIYIGKQEDSELVARIQKKWSDIKNISANSGFNNSCYAKKFDELLKHVAVNRITGSLTLVNNYIKGENSEPITHFLQPLICVELHLNPGKTTKGHISQLMMIKQLKNYALPHLYRELIRSSLSSLYNVSGICGTNRESMWCAFSFIKVPQIIRNIHVQTKEYGKLNYSPDVVYALELLVDDPLLDFLDTKCACNTIEYLLEEFLKHHLITEQHRKHFNVCRDSVAVTLSKMDLNNQQPSIIKLVKRAEPPLSGILKALDGDYNKMHEALLGMLCQVLSGSGNSFELILSVAAVEEKLKLFVSRLIHCNESSKQIIGDPPTLTKNRAILFDVSFLMLTFIVQTYGADAVLDGKGNSLFEKWAREFLLEKNKTKSPITMVHQCDQSIVDEFLANISNLGDAFDAEKLKWQDVCMNLPGVLYNMMVAWENDTVSAAEVKGILDFLKLRLCSYSVCTAAWICSYIQMIPDDELLKPMNMVQQLSTPITAEDLASSENLKERMGLTAQILRKMQIDVHQNNKIRSAYYSNAIVLQTPLEEHFADVWKSITELGWMPIESTQGMDGILFSSGPYWLTTNLVNQILQCKYAKDMNKTMDLVFAVMHLNLEACTLTLISDILPLIVLNKQPKIDIIEAQATVLARLCVYCIISLLDGPVELKKRTIAMCGSFDCKSRLAKVRKLNDNSTAPGEIKEEVGSKKSDQSNDVDIVREPLQSCLQNLFKSFTIFTNTDELSPRTYFIYQFLLLLQTCGGPRRSKPVLKLLPQGLVQNLLKVLNTDDSMYDFVLRFNDLSTASGKQNAMSDLCLLRTIQVQKSSVPL